MSGPMGVDNEDMSQLWDQEEARTTPVSSDRCMWCKIPRKDWDDDVTGVSLDTGEVMCSKCHGDIREYNRFRKFTVTVSDEFAPAARAVVHKYAEKMAEELTDLYEGDPNLPFLGITRSDANSGS